MNCTIELKDVLQKLTSIITINVPENELDRDYSRQYFKTSIDAEKILDGKFGSFVVKSFTESLIKSMEAEPKFPFQKVAYNFSLVFRSHEIFFSPGYLSIFEFFSV